jgi:hypothetical protein
MASLWCNGRVCRAAIETFIVTVYLYVNIIRIIKSRRMRRAEHVWGKRELHTGFWWGYLREGDHLGDPGVDGRRY